MFRGGEAAATKTMIFAMVTKTEGIEEVQYIQIKKKKISQKLSWPPCCWWDAKKEDYKGQSFQKEREIHIPVPIDTSKIDEEFYKRMQEFEALLPDVPSDR